MAVGPACPPSRPEVGDGGLQSRPEKHIRRAEPARKADLGGCAGWDYERTPRMRGPAARGHAAGAEIGFSTGLWVAELLFDRALGHTSDDAPRSRRRTPPPSPTVADTPNRHRAMGRRSPPRNLVPRPRAVSRRGMNYARIAELLGNDADSLLTHSCAGIPKERIALPGPDFVERVWIESDRSPAVLGSLQALYDHGRLGGTGYVSILPVDQGIEHSAGASFAKNPDYFDPSNIVELAIEGGCNGVASTLGVLGMCGRKYAHRIPFILKINHNELLTYPNKADQILFASVKQARDMGARAIGATIYFGSDNSGRQIVEISAAFQAAHEAGLATILWCYLRNNAFKKDGVDYHVSADLSGQANHLGATIQADIVKQKLPENNGGYNALNFAGSSYGKTDKRIYEKLTTANPIDLVRYQVANGYMGKIGLINSGGASGGETDLAEAVKTAVINKRGGGMGLISGRKAFQKPRAEGVALLHAIQDVYRCGEVTVA